MSRGFNASWFCLSSRKCLPFLFFSVLAPPGGRSNFSLSDGSVPEPAPAQRASACQAARNKSSVFDSEPVAAPVPKVAPALVTSAPDLDRPRQGYRSTQPPGGFSNNIFG